MVQRLIAVAASMSIAVVLLLSLLGWVKQPVQIVQATGTVAQVDCITVTSDIAAFTIWNQACYHVITNVKILPNAVLAIMPVTTTRVEFEAESRLTVQGQLQVLGQPEQLITLTAFNPALPWGGIAVGVGGGATLQYVAVESATIGLDSADADNLQVLSSTFRFNGYGYLPEDKPIKGAIIGDIDNSQIVFNRIYNSTNGVVLKESSDNVINGNVIWNIEGIGLGLLKAVNSFPTDGGNRNQILYNEIYQAQTGLRVEKGTANQIITNSVYLNPSSGLSLIDQVLAVVRANHVFSNGQTATGDYQAAILITSTDTLVPYAAVVQQNVAYAGNGSAIVFGAGTSAGQSFRGNAICADWPEHYALDDHAGSALLAPNNWWGTNAPVSGTHYVGPVSVSDPIVLSMTVARPNLPADATTSTIVTLTLHDSIGNTVPKSNRSTDVNARLIQLQSSLGTLNPMIVEVNEQGVATATLTAGRVTGSGLVTATAFCDYPITATISVTPTNVAVSKQTLTAETELGTLITYTIAYSNTSNVLAPQVRLTDTLPAGLMYVTDTSGYSAQVTDNQIVWAPDTLPPNSRADFMLTAQVRNEAQWCGQNLTNTLQISTSALETSLADNVTTTLTALKVVCADWSVTKQADRTEGVPDAPIDFTIVFTNGGNVPMTSVVITDELPTETHFVFAAPVPTGISGRNLAWNLVGLFQPNVPYTLGVRLAYTGTRLDNWLTNTVGITSPVRDVNPNNNLGQARYHVYAMVNLVVSKTGNRRVAHPGENLIYTIGVTNLGTYTATNIVLTETLPALTEYVGYDWTSIDGVTYTLTIPSLGPGTSQFRPFIVRVKSNAVTLFPPGDHATIINTACSLAEQGDVDPSSNCDTYETPIEPNHVYLPIVLSPPPHVQFVTSRVRMAEDIGKISIGVMLDKVTPQPVIVTCSTSDGSAKAGLDYTPTIQSILFSASEVGPKSCAVGLIDDDVRENNDEAFYLNLSNPQNAALGSPIRATIVISPSDPCVISKTELISNYSPMDLAYDPETDRLFIANRDGIAGGSVSVTHVSPIQPIANITGVLSAQGIAYDATRQRLYVVGWDWLNVLDANTYTVITTVTLGSGGMAFGVDYNPNNNKIYISNYNSDPSDVDHSTVIVVDAETLTVIGRLINTKEHPLREPSYVVVNPDTNKVYVADHNRGKPNGWVTIIDSATDQIVKTLYLDPGGELFSLALDRLHNRIFVTGIGVANVYAINGLTDLQDPPNKALKITRSNGKAIPLRMIAVNSAAENGQIRLWLTSSSTEDTGLDQLIATTGQWELKPTGEINMSKPFLGTAVPRSPERGLRYDPVTNQVFVASAAANLIMIFPDTPKTQQCMDPLRSAGDDFVITTVTGEGTSAFEPERWWAR